MPTVLLSPIGGSGQQFFDNNGVPLAGGKLYTYAAGTTTPLASYTDSTGGVANANPVVLDSAGRVSGGIWLVSASSYKIVLKTSADVTLGSWDNLSLLYGATTAQIAAVTANTAAIAAINAVKSGFRAYRAGALTISSGDFVHFDTEVYDRLNEYNPATGVWTPTVAGVYLIAAGVCLTTSQADGSAVAVNIYNSNGPAYRAFSFYPQGAAGGWQYGGADLFRVSVGDAYSVLVQNQSAASSVTVGDQFTHFSAQYLGPQ